MQQEQLRHQYLEALGISSWLSTAELPGAAPSPDWVDDFQYPAPEIPFQSNRAADARAALGIASADAKSSTPAVSSAPTTANTPNKASTSATMLEARAALGLGEPEAEQSTAPADTTVSDTENAVDKPASTRMETPNFKLAFMRVGEVLVIDSLPPQGGTFTENYQALASAICASLGERSQAVAAFMLPWPMFASKTLDQSYPQAVIAVQHKLSKELKAAPVKLVLLFGEAAAQMVMKRDEPLDQLRGIAFALRSDIKALATSSLTEAMQLPGVKKQIWHDLQPVLTVLT